MKRAFTLIELLVVMAIMGVLGTIAAGSYVAMNRGQAEKSALEIAGNLIEIARQRANLDRCRTYVFVYNEVQSLDENDEPGKVCGLALAVKGVGRFSAVDGNDWYDEFGDLDQLFRAMQSENEGEELTEADYERKSSKSRIFSLRQQDFAVVRTGQRSEMTEEDLEDGETHQQVVFGYRKLEGNISFTVGEEYGREFAAARLPNGYVFSRSVSMRNESDLGLKKVDVYVINPDGDAQPLQIYSRQFDGSFKPLGSTADVETEN